MALRLLISNVFFGFLCISLTIIFLIAYTIRHWENLKTLPSLLLKSSGLVIANFLAAFAYMFIILSLSKEEAFIIDNRCASPTKIELYQHHRPQDKTVFSLQPHESKEMRQEFMTSDGIIFKYDFYVDTVLKYTGEQSQYLTAAMIRSERFMIDISKECVIDIRIDSK